MYEFVTFKAADVKDLKIDDPHPKREQPGQQGFVDPAILGVSISESSDSCGGLDVMKHFTDVKGSTPRGELWSESAKTMWISPLPSF